MINIVITVFSRSQPVTCWCCSCRPCLVSDGTLWVRGGRRGHKERPRCLPEVEQDGGHGAGSGDARGRAHYQGEPVWADCCKHAVRHWLFIKSSSLHWKLYTCTVILNNPVLHLQLFSPRYSNENRKEGRILQSWKWSTTASPSLNHWWILMLPGSALSTMLVWLVRFQVGAATLLFLLKKTLCCVFVF